jgi:hypothetical protein
MDLTQTKTNRIGGYNRVQIMKAEDISSFPTVNGQQVTINPESIVSSSSWTTLQFTPGSIGVSVKPERSGAGTSLSTEITGSFPDDDPDSLTIIKQFDRRKCIVRVRGNNGKEKLYGTRENPLRFSFAPTDNQKTTDPTGYIIKLSGTLITDPLFIINS